MIKLLALHGNGSNGNVTRLQLENLNISESEYEIVYLNAPILAEEPGAGVAEAEGLITGPWYSWLTCYDGDGELDSDALLNKICEALQMVLTVIDKQGPFDGIFGFSQGAVIASLVCGLPHDEALLSALKNYLGQSSLTDFNKETILFPAAVFSCAALSMPLLEMRLKARLGATPISRPNIRVLHLIGIEDPFRSISESFAQSWDTDLSNVYYLQGHHEINRLQRNDSELNSLICQCFSEHSTRFGQVSASQEALEWKASCNVSSCALLSDRQVAVVKLETEGIPETFLDMLAAHPPDAPLFRMARERDENVVTRYGQMHRFCQPEGEGDLRRIGVQSGEVVAYLVPHYDSALAAAAFISIASQTCAAPLGQNMSESEALFALNKFNVKHMVLFECTPGKGVRNAFERYADQGKARLHHAGFYERLTPGLFKYHNSIEDFENLPKLENPKSAKSLLLCTSGTTSEPKVVPLRQCDLVLNGAILADSIGIDSNDVTYNIMPLNHIGGICGSILSSISVGATITHDGPYNPLGMIEALSNSIPRPTWYSAVPTIHNATMHYLHDNADEFLDKFGQWNDHNLRIVRSGADVFRESNRKLLETMFGCVALSTYSMSEQMPISQPHRDKHGWTRKSGAVGVPIAASLAIINTENMRPLPYGRVGEIAISGPTVFKGYLDNPDANTRSHFLMKSPEDDRLQTWFLTGDLGVMDCEGSLTLDGRSKELIKRGGEQVAPHEIETVLTQHLLIQNALCFPIPSDIYGEEVGCAFALEPSIAHMIEESQIIIEMKELLRRNDVAHYKVPSFWKLVKMSELPKTASGKFVRNKLAEFLGLSIENGRAVLGESQDSDNPKTAVKKKRQNDIKSEPVTDSNIIQSSTTAVQPDKPIMDWSVLAGLRFILVCYVMFMHFGSSESWGAFSNLRQFPWHVHAFFTLTGFSLAITMPSFIKNKMPFIKARIFGIYPLYGLAILLLLGNLFISCRPSTFMPEFSWSMLFSDAGQAFCQGTPLVQDSWLANVILTFIIHATGLHATPLWAGSWFLGFYLWFISVYFQCLIVFPFIYNAMYKNRGKTKRLLMLTLVSLVVNLVIVLGFWYGFADSATGYGLFDPQTGLRAAPNPNQIEIAGKDNAVILGFYLFSPFWMVYLVAGMCAAFLYDAIRPAERKNSKIWGHVADIITLGMIAVSVAHIIQGYSPYGPQVAQVAQDAFFMRPEAANSYADPSVVNRIWDSIWGRLFAPITLLWIFALSTGKGFTSKLLRFSPLSQNLATTTYGCFLFHQVVGQWYYAATRNGEWWDWWSDQKVFYWFSPQPVSVEWYEFFYLVGLVVLFTKVAQSLNGALTRGVSTLFKALKKEDQKREAPELEKNTKEKILMIINQITGFETKPELSLDECGIASLGILEFVNKLESEFSNSLHKIKLEVQDIITAQDIEEIASIVDTAIRNTTLASEMD